MAQQPNLLQGPEPVETAELHFKLYCKLKIFETETKYEKGHCCLLAVSQYYGLIFVGNCNGFSVIQTKSLSPTINLEKFPKRDVILNLRPTHISVDFTQKILAVVCSSKPGSVLVFYNIQTFGCKDVAPLKIVPIAKLVQNLAAEVVDLAWQPNAEGSLMICMADGSVLALSQGVKDGPIFALPNTTQATCFCWSPKGKQIVVGSASGTLSQYKPDLKVVKTLPSPPLFNGAAMVVSVLWISSFQFAVSYNSRTNPESFPVITIVNAAKNEPVNVINYEDITYSSTLFRNHQIYMTHQSSWNLIFVSSANSIEVAVLHLKDSLAWEQWLLGDASRAELPLDPDRQETFPLGWAFDFTSQDSIPWGEGTLPPMPRLLLVSDEGLLCVFNIVNAKENAPQLCAPPNEKLDDSFFVISNKVAPTPAPPPPSLPPKPVQTAKSLLGSPPVFGNLKPTYTFESGSGFGGFETAQPPSTTPQVAHPTKEEFSFFPDRNLSQSTPTKQQESQIEKTITAPTPIIKKPEEVIEPAGKTEAAIHGESPLPETPELSAVDDSVYLSALEEEIEHFNSELQQLSVKVSNLDVNLGSEEDKLKARKCIDDLHDFCKELRETTEGQNAEIHDVVMDLMEAFAWLEDAKSRNLQRKNPSYIELKKSEELDPLSARHMSEISHLKFYIENQLKQLTSFLEKEWMEYQENYRNEIKNRMSVPPLEEVYKTMHFQLKILHKQRVRVKELKEKISAKKGKSKSQKFLSSVDSSVTDENNKTRVSELSKLAENLLQLKINEEENSPRTGAWEMINLQLSAISERSKKLTRDKQAALRDALSECDMVKIRPVKTTLESSTFLRSLALEKSASKATKFKPPTKPEQPKEIENSTKPDIILTQVTKSEPKPQPERERTVAVKKDEVSKTSTVSIEKPLAPSTLQSLTHLEGKSPLDPLSGIVSSIGKKNETKPQQAFVFGSLNFDKPEPVKESIGFGPPKTEQKQEGLKTTQLFTFSVSKPVESIFNKKDPAVFNAKPFFGLTNSTSVTSLKPDSTKTTPAPNVTILPVTSTPATTATPVTATPSPFSFNVVTTVANTPNLPKINLLFPGKEQGSGFGATTTSASIFSLSSPATQTSASVIFCTAAPIFGDGNKTTVSTFATSTSSLFNIPKTSEAPIQSSGFTFTPTVENKSAAPVSAVATPIKPTPETEEVDVENVDESVKKPQTTSEKSKDSPKGVGVSSIFAISPSASATPEVSVTTSASTSVSVPQNALQSTGIFSKPIGLLAANVSVAPVESTSTSSFVTATTSVTTTTAVKSATSAFSFSTTSLVFDQTATATSTTTAGLFGTPTTSTSVFGQVSSSTSSTNIFGGSTPTPLTVDIFGKPAKPIFDQAATPSTTSENIFGTSTATTNTFGQGPILSSTTAFGQVSVPPTTTATTTITTITTTSTTTTTTTTTTTLTPIPTTTTTTTTTFISTTTPSLVSSASPTTSSTFGQVSTSPSTTAFGQKSDSVSQTANLFGQLLSDNNRQVFGTPSTTSATAASIFSTPKNIFGGGASITTAPLFGTTSSSIFPQTTSVFGQSTTSPSIFGQSQTSTSSSFFGQNVCSPFGSGASSVTSNQNNFESGGFSKPIFGQSVFGQSTNSTSVFRGPSSSLFGGTSSTTSSNVFQTPTTSTTFGSTSPGPFSGGSSSFGENSFRTTASSFQKPLGGFGGPSVFGGAPAFGSSATFGGSPGFGSLPAFGNMPQGTFGQTAGSTTFENLANQNTVGFGNLAQRSQNQGFGNNFGSPTFENKPAFGGNSFSSWRSK